ncbi:MAG: group III truncated hemoglobin [Proteobacteria bacterium]|nr:group III truncated hemoglobin [Pseudomonadota bacterium]
MIERLVRGFYARVRADALLAPVFASKISDWEPHLRTMFSFWSSVTLMSGDYHGQPMAKHLALGVDGRHFDRWLELFGETARELCPPQAAERFVMLAQRIARSLELGIASAHGVLLGPEERFLPAVPADARLAP